MPSRPLVLLSFAAMSAVASAQFSPNLPAQGTPVRTYDLIDVDARLVIDWPNRSFDGVVVNRLKPLKSGDRKVRLMAGKPLNIRSVRVNGRPATFARKDRDLLVDTPATVAGREMRVEVTYRSVRSKGGGFGADGGWHWVEPNGNVNRAGYWTQGETEYVSEYIPTYDYPDDFATSRTEVEVPSDWTVIGNGEKEKDVVRGARRTVAWRMKIPHATYLIANYGFPMETRTDEVDGLPLIYAAPRGQGNKIEPSFSDTPDMIRFFNQRFGVKYPWNKYAQVAAYDFGGGMENVSATILGVSSLTDGKREPRAMASLNAHELAHQWFGDLVTCKSWEHAWLNESWATYGQIVYFDHARGRYEFMRELEGAFNSYLGETRRYKRPIQTAKYPHPDAMFDSHLYPKGALVLNSLRTDIGDDAFWKGVKKYLTDNAHKPVETKDFERAMSWAAGRDLTAWFDTWIRKPGHPVIATEMGANGASVTLRQTQSGPDEPPLYPLPKLEVLLVSKDGRGESRKMPMAETATTIVTSGEVVAVVVDPMRRYLIESQGPVATSREGLLALALAPLAPPRVRTTALRELAKEPIAPGEAALIFAALRKDLEAYPSVTNTRALFGYEGPGAAEFWRAEADHANYDRRRLAQEKIGR